MSRHRTHEVEVPGGRLAVGEWTGGGTPVLLLHGITAHHRGWDLVADALPDHRVLAPDLRGRGRSRVPDGPWGMARHADDAALVLDALGAGPAVVVGHSMGGFVAAVLAHRHPHLVDRLVLVDGGLPFAPAELETTRAALAAIRARLEARFADEAAYVALFRSHPAFARDWSAAAETYASYDATRHGDGVGAAADLDGVLADQADVLDGDDLPAALEALAARADAVPFLHAPRGFVDDPPGLYADATVRGLTLRFPAVAPRLVEGVNHYTVVLSERGAAAVAAAVG